MDEPESLDSDMPELQECSYDALEALSQDDEEEVEELENSLREVIQDHSVKPKLQCLMVDPSFSMVTVQSEDSGIVWETASSRCSTPWASETSSVSEGGSMEASGAAGNITIIFDEDKVVRRRTRSGRSSRLSDRFSRPGSSRSASALGVERLEMMEVSQPNVKQDKTENEPDLEEIKNKDQELFNLIAEGYEILNIRVPFKLPTVDEESTELQDNLSYLDQTPKIKSRNHHHQQLTRAEEGDLQDVEPLNKESKEAVPNLPSTPDFKPAPTEGPGDIDYFEKFTLLDVVAPGEEASGEVDECVTPVPTPEPETKDPVKNRSPSVSEESFVFVSNEDIVGEHLDEVFYGESPPADAVHKQDAEDKGGRMRRQSSVKESGSVLFESEETVLTPIYISSGPPKIIDQILLDEPTAMSFMYTDLYEDAMGEKRRSDEECSEAESVTSEKSYKRCLMDDYEEADGGYLEKFTLKDETAYVEVSSEVVEERKGGRMMWLQNEFEMSGCLTRVAKEEDGEETKNAVEAKAITPCESESTSESASAQVEHEKTGLDEREKSAQKSGVIKEKDNDIQKPQTEFPLGILGSEPSVIPENSSVIEENSSEKDITDKVLAKVAAIDTPAPALDISQTVIRGEETQEFESVTDAVIVDTELEIPNEAPHQDTCLEVNAECEPPVQAIVEVIENSKTDCPTHVRIDLQEVKLPSTAVESSAAVMGQEDTMIKDNAELEQVEEKTELVKEQEVPSAALVEAEIPPGPVKEMVDVGDELLLFIPKGHAVEMDIQVSPQPDTIPAVQDTEQTDDTPLGESVMQPEIAMVSTFEESEAKESVDLFEVRKKEADLKSDVEKQEIVCSIFETDVPVEVQEPTIEMLKPEVEETAKGDVEFTVDDTPLVESVMQPEIEMVSTFEESEVKVDVDLPEVRCKEAGPKSDVEPEVEETAKGDAESTVDNLSEISISKQERHLEEIGRLPPEEIPLTDATDRQHATQLQDEDIESIITNLKDEDGRPTVIEQCHNAETEVHEAVSIMDTVPTNEAEIESVSAEVGLLPVPVEEGKSVALEQPVATSINEIEKVVSISPIVAETEEFDFEIVNDVKEPHAVDLEAQREVISTELEEEFIEYNVAADEEQTSECNIEEVAGLRSTLKRFTPLQDLSGLDSGDMSQEIEVLEENTLNRELQMNLSVDVEDVSMQEDSEKQAPSDVTMEYEIITEQDVTEIEQMHEEKAPLVTDELLEDVMEEPAGSEEVAEVDYDTIDAEEEQQARMAAELEGLDWFCLSCECLLSEEESSSEPHQDHKVIAVDRAYGEIMDKLSDWISELQGRSENIEDLVSELELAYNSVEDQFHENEVDMQAQKEEMMTLVMEQYNSMSVSMEEEKKAKLEQLYDQIVSLQESIETAKGTLETTAREAETDARSPEDIHGRLTAALDSTMSLELGPKGLLVFEDYAKGNPSSSQLAQRKGIAVPQRPTLQAQEPGSATSSSVTVYWKVNADDIIDCFQVYCMEDPLGAVSEEYRVTVKESYCVLEELEPDKTYKVWVMAVNYTGCSLPSVRLVFKTAPSVPVIDIERCTVMWNTAVLRWSSLGETGLSYTLEHCRQYELEGEGLRTIAGIKNLEYKVLLQPNENYLFYIKAVNEAGSSEQSEAALISTKGMKFHLLKETAHPALELSVDETTLHYSQETYDNMPDKTCPFILGELLPMRGNFYWEYDVSRCTDYRLGVAYSSAASDSVLGEGQGSWCLQCTPTLSGCSYRLLHNDVHSSLFVIDSPERVGVFLDHQFGRLSFYNAQSGQLLGSFSERLTQPCHPALGMDSPGSVEVCMVTEVPDFTKDS
ncbi:unnamed protein product [Knipowitschia caucasica]